MRFSVFFFLLLSVLNLATAQRAITPEVEKELVSKLNNQSLKMPSQSIYIQTDKDIYELGEDLWFKAYVLDAQTKILDDRSYVLFVQFLDDTSQNIFAEERLEIVNGIATGHIFIPEDWEEGDYILTAYTQFSLLKNSTEIHSYKPVKLKKAIVPKIIAHVNFDKKDYQTQDTIRCKLEIYSRRGEPIMDASVKVMGMEGDRKGKVWREKTDEKGLVLLEIPASEKRVYSSLAININKNDKQESFSYVIPRESNRALQLGFYPEGGHLVAGINNNLAFKAVNELGLPIQVEGAIYDGEHKVIDFDSEHDGMGILRIKPLLGSNYSVRLSLPVSDSIYGLPPIEQSGIAIRAQESNSEVVRFTIEKTETLDISKIFVRAQSRGVVHWMAIGKFDASAIHFSIPVSKLPQGVVEVTVFDENYTPLVERLIYSHFNKNLKLELLKSRQNEYKTREKITLKFKINEESSNISRTNLGVRVYSSRYSDSLGGQNILTHQYLTTELKGYIYNPKYYFDEAGDNKYHHLNLLLLTQGWRSYKWNKENLREIRPYNLEGDVSEDLLGNFYIKSPEGTLNVGGTTVINVASQNGILPLFTNVNGAFSLPRTIFKETQGHTFLIKPIKEGVLKYDDPFTTINRIREAKAFKPSFKQPYQWNKKTTFLNDTFGFDKVNALQEVVLTGYKEGRSNKGNFIESSFAFTKKDYVCLFNILNCSNHSSGRMPQDGRLYKSNVGTPIVYREPFPSKDLHIEASEDFIALEGFYPEKTFYSPVYDKKDDFYVPDYRKTLLWEPNIYVDNNNIVELSFYASDVSSIYNVEIEGINEQGIMGVLNSKIRVQN